MKQETKLIDINKLVYSKTNPRTMLVKFNPGDPDFIDLCSSIEQHGVIQNILVRPVGKNYEVIDGERRVRASKKLGIKKVKADVRNLTDIEVMEIQLIGFDHRKGIHPLAEATAMKALMDLGTYSIQMVADRLGKKASYVAQTLYLLNLIDSAKELFAEGKLELGHARLISKHQPADQNRILKHLEGSNFRQPADSLAGWIHGVFMLNLNKAPFKIKDPLLLQDAGSCIECKKRTGSDPDLFPEVSGSNICTDPSCYKRKIDAHVDLSIHLAETEGKPLVKVDSSFYSDTKKDILGWKDYERYNPETHKKEDLLKAIVVKGENKGSIIQIVKKTEKPTVQKVKKETPKDLAEEENTLIEARRDALLRQNLSVEILNHPDFKKQFLPAVARAILNQDLGFAIDEYFYFPESVDFTKMTDEEIIEHFNVGAVLEAARENTNYTLEFLFECCGFLGIDYKPKKEKVWTENQLVTVDEIKKQLKNGTYKTNEQKMADAINELTENYKINFPDLTIKQIEEMQDYKVEKEAIGIKYGY